MLYADIFFNTVLTGEAESMYETKAPVNIDERITMRIEVNGGKAYMSFNDAKYSKFVADEMKGSTTYCSIALWVDMVQ